MGISNMDFASIGIVAASLIVVAIGYFFLRKKKKEPRWEMDPRLNDLALWAYACMLDVTGLSEANALPVPNVKGVSAPWGSGAFGTFYMPSRSIKVQITRPYAHLVDIMLHEMGHDGDWRKHGKSTGEDYANWVNDQCKESVRPDFYPAPKVA